VQADKKEVKLPAGAAAADQVMIANALEGIVTLRLQAPQVAGLKIELDRTELKKGERAKLSFAWTPGSGPAPRPFDVLVVVEPINVTIPISVSVN
jgi:hypothetical protein